MESLRIMSVNISPEKGTAKKGVSSSEVGLSGLDGDAHAGNWHRQVSLLDSESIGAFAARTGLEISPGDFGENVTTEGLDLSTLRVGDRLFGKDGLELVVTQLGKECHGDNCAIYGRVGKCVMPSRGVFCRVESPGVLRRGASLSVIRCERGENAQC